MKRFSRPPRMPATLSQSINQHLNMYTLTATAAGVGIMALAQPVQAKIIYTPAHVNFTQFPPVTLDVNHDGIGDFVLALGGDASSGGWAWQYAFVYAPRSNNTDQVVATDKRSYAPAVALRAGARIGPGRLFGNVDILVEHYSYFGKHSSHSSWKDQWANGGKGLKDRYLGLKFMINGEVHFGWARVTVTTSGGDFTATLTGYAYETIANKSIIAGKTKGPSNEAGGEQASAASLAAPAPAHAMLGVLALGAQGLTLWRRKESTEATSE
jgi:hypothetical protein